MPEFRADQSLNAWVDMLHGLYGLSQNYSKSSYEVHSHLAEVCGVFGKHLFKRRDPLTARDFLPKIFAWAVALMKAVRPEESDLEAIVLRKFPGICPYCGKAPCGCGGEKPSYDAEALRAQYYRWAASFSHRSLNDFQLMFSSIYGETWTEPQLRGAEVHERLRLAFARLIEELAELAESIRFHHLYHGNFDNELADFLAWWFALLSSLPSDDGSGPLLADDIVWTAYPGYCIYCDSFPCFCRPGPVRELMSKPSPGELDKFDVLTSVYNRTKFDADVSSVAAGRLRAALPLCCVRLDIDDFKLVNDTHGHSAGDAALRHVAEMLRAKMRERDRVYRIGGDEFGIVLMDATAEEAHGMMTRVLKELGRRPVRWVSAEGDVAEFNVSLSIGIAQCDDEHVIAESFERSDQASYESKRAGKGRVTLSASGRPAQE